jgi:riboflavin kinase / FMN adenylyltransferase
MSFIVVHSAEEWAARIGRDSRTVMAIGNFDGVHCGHRRILERVVERARRDNCISAALTFSPHPLRVLRPEAAPPLIETLSQRLTRMEGLGLDAVFVMAFELALAAMPPEKFVEHILGNTLHAKVVLVGENFRFGHRQAGDVQTLRQLGREFDFEVECAPPVIVRGTIASSSAIRAAVSAGNMSRAARLLGRPFSLAGEVRTGTGTGRRFVFPTLNLATEQELLPARGVYATETIVRERCYRAATNVGVRPTFDGTHLSIESQLFDFSEEITAGSLEVRFWHRLRSEQKFSAPEALRNQIQRDLAATRSFFARLDAARRIARRAVKL